MDPAASLHDSIHTPTSPRLVRALLLGQPAADGIDILVWPADADRRPDAADHVPRLLLLEEGEDPPVCSFLEEWVRLPALMDDVYARLHMVRSRCSCVSIPELRDEGVLAFDRHREVIPAAQLPLLELLVAGYRTVVRREDLADAYAAAGATATDEAVKAALFRLNQRLLTVGLVLRTIRGKGFLLEPVEGCRSGN
jgi:hypothetical protein